MELYENDFCCMELYDKHFRCMEVNLGYCSINLCLANRGQDNSAEKKLVQQCQK